jgi:hypothetical protein
VSLGGDGFAFGAPVGISTAKGTPSDVKTLSPDAPVTPSNLSVQLTTTVPAGDVDVELLEGHVDLIGCLAHSGERTCTIASGGAIPVPIPASTPYAVEVFNGTGVTYSADVLFGYQLIG